jgi:hypothetical protein
VVRVPSRDLNFNADFQNPASFPSPHHLHASPTYARTYPIDEKKPILGSAPPLVMTTPVPLSATSATHNFPESSTLPPNAFDFVADLHALIYRVFNDELDIKDIAQEANRIRLKIQTARGLVAQLPEVDRTQEEQQEEIRALEEKIAKQRQVLKEVSELPAVTEIIGGGGGGGKMDVDS